MATEKNPFEQIEKEITNVIQLPEKQEEGEKGRCNLPDKII